MSRPLVKTIPGVGNVSFVSSSRARRVSISVRMPGRIRVSVPQGVSMSQAEAFVLQKRFWILRHLTRMRRWELEESIDETIGIRLSEPEARRMLRSRVEELAHLYGFSFNRVFVRSQKTRWGSCSGKNNINLNLKLATLPDMLRDYVILHELVHTRIKNHGRDFWRELSKFVGDARGLRDQLNRISLED